MVTPWDFVDLYHSLDLTDISLGLSGRASIHKYRHGKKNEKGAVEMPASHGTAQQQLIQGIYKALKMSWKQPLPARFYLPDHFGSEPFFHAGIARAYNNRASPDELRDVIRLRVATGVTSAARAVAHAQEFFAIDCNAFVGNYLGVSPNFAIFSYVNGYGNAKTIYGASRDIYAARSAVPLTQHTDPNSVQCGDVLVNFNAKAELKWVHIGLIQSWTYTPPKDGAKRGKAVLGIGEWGGDNATSPHKVPESEVEVLTGNFIPGYSKSFVGYKAANGDFKVVLDSFKLRNAYLPRGWEIANTEAV
jgi:hypothetical protein